MLRLMVTKSQIDYFQLLSKQIIIFGNSCNKIENEQFWNKVKSGIFVVLINPTLYFTIKQINTKLGLFCIRSCPNVSRIHFKPVIVM